MDSALPVYLALDVSGSTFSFALAYNQGIDRLIDISASNPQLAEFVHLGIITFSEDVRVELPLTELTHIGRAPTIESRGPTFYGGTFRLLRQLIAEDVAILKAHNKRVYRPTVLFITDGEPLDDWQNEHLHLTQDFRLRPIVFAIGIGDVDARTILRVASRPDLAFMARPGEPPALGLKAAFDMLADLLSSLLRSATSSLDGSMPAAISTPEGLMQIPEQFR